MRYTILALVTLALALIFYYVADRKFSKKPRTKIFRITPGKIQGVISISREGREYHEFVAIPYAKPPIGKLRFEPPQEHEPWGDEVLFRNRYGHECPQYNGILRKFVGRENCLFVNVYSPFMRPKKLLPVMVFIHGGLFMFGSSNIYRPTYFMDHDIVLVTMNYRIASFGFLNTGDDVVRGNMGLKDQLMALKWIKRNIRYFGGDPNQITVFGESAGAASIHLHLLSPKSKGLFHRAILQSGVALNQWVIKPFVQQQTIRFASRLNCIKETTREMVDCLKKVSTKRILKSHMDAREMFRDPLSLFGPSIETVPHKDLFLDTHPKKLILAGKFQKVPIIIGYNSHEGLLSAPEIVINQSALTAFDSHYFDVMPSFIYYPKKGQAAVEDMKAIRRFYFGPDEKLDSISKLDNYTNLFTDWVWAIGIERSLGQHAKSSPTYAYYYSYKGRFQLTTVIMATQGLFPPILELCYKLGKNYFFSKLFNIEPEHLGACHGDDIPLLFKVPTISNISPDHKDYEMSKEIVKLWVSFASQKDLDLKFMDQSWPKVNKKSKVIPFLKIDNNPTILGSPNAERIQFLGQYHP